MNATVLSLVIAAAVSCASSASGDPLPRTADHDYDAPAPGTYALPAIKLAGDGAVIDSDGRALQLKELTRGRATVLSFIYTRCGSAKACPYATGVLNQLQAASEKDAQLASAMRLVSLSFDPENDTPEKMAAYASWAARRTKSCEWRFVTTRSRGDLAPILEQYGQAVGKRTNPSDPQGPLNHALRVFLIDAEGKIRNIYNSETLDVRLVLSDVKTLLAGG